MSDAIRQIAVSEDLLPMAARVRWAQDQVNDLSNCRLKAQIDRRNVHGLESLQPMMQHWGMASNAEEEHQTATIYVI